MYLEAEADRFSDVPSRKQLPEWTREHWGYTIPLSYVNSLVFHTCLVTVWGSSRRVGVNIEIFLVRRCNSGDFMRTESSSMTRWKWRWTIPLWPLLAVCRPYCFDPSVVERQEFDCPFHEHRCAMWALPLEVEIAEYSFWSSAGELFKRWNR